MPSKTAKPTKAENDKTIFVPRERLALIYSLKPPTDAQKAVLSSERIHSWHRMIEFKASEAAMTALKELDVAWCDKK